MNATDDILAVVREVDNADEAMRKAELDGDAERHYDACEASRTVLSIWADAHEDAGMDNFASALREIAAAGIWPYKDSRNGWVWVYKCGDGFGFTKWTLCMTTINRIQEALGMVPTELIMRHISASRAIAALAGVLCRLPQSIRDIVFVPLLGVNQ